jgi:hypothetical protein
MSLISKLQEEFYVNWREEVSNKRKDNVTE